LEHKIRVATRDLDPVRDTHRSNLALQELLATIAKAPRLQDGGSVQTRLREQQVLNRLAREFRIDEAELRSQLAQLRQGARTRRAFATSEDAAPRKKRRLAQDESHLFELLLLRPEAVPGVLERVAISALRTETAKLMFEKYADLEAAGVYADLNRLLIEFDDVELKSLLVKLDEDAHRKSKSDFDMAIKEAVAKFTKKHAEEELRGDQAALSKFSLEDDLEEGKRRLQEIVRKAREVSET
jgi:hypothetical protein